MTAMLIVAAGALLRSWFSAHQVDPGFGRHPAVIASLAPGSGRSEDEHRAFYDAYLQKVTNIPGVVSAGITTAIPLQPSFRTTLRLWIPGVDPPPGETSHLVDWGVVGGDYFAVMGIPLLAGRLFDSRDDARSGTVAIVSETMAEHFWPDQDPLGRELAFWWRLQPGHRRWRGRRHQGSLPSPSPLVPLSIPRWPSRRTSVGPSSPAQRATTPGSSPPCSRLPTRWTPKWSRWPPRPWISTFPSR